MSRRSSFELIVLLSCIFASCVTASTTWPTLHRDYRRSGYTDEVVPGPYERKWFRDFHDEMIATRVEAIVAEDKCFVGTFAGNLYALAVNNGETVWKFTAGGPIGHSPCYHDDKIVFGADDGILYCLRANDGKPIWKSNAGAGIWTSPATDGERIYFGDRAGFFHALDLSGRLLWRFKTPNCILCSPSLADGKVVFGSEDMHVYCLEAASGRLVWKSAKLPGLSMRDYAPTIWKDIVIVRTNPAYGFHRTLTEDEGFMFSLFDIRIEKWQNLLKPDPKAKDNYLRKSYGFLEQTGQAVRKEQAANVKRLKAEPWRQTFHAFDVATGTPRWTSPIYYMSGLHNPPTPPTFGPDGRLYTFFRSVLTNYDMRGEVRPFTNVGEVDYDTGLIRPIAHAHGERMPWGIFECIGDESESLSLMGGQLICTHQGVLGCVDLNTRRLSKIWGVRDSYGGIFGPGVQGSWDGAKRLAAQGYLTGMPNEWHGPARGVVSIAAGRMFWVVGSQVVCVGHRDGETAPSGGMTPPSNIKLRGPRFAGGGNVVSGLAREDDASVERIELSAEEVMQFIEPPPATVTQSNRPLARKLRSKLNRVMTELIDGGPWAPFVVELGIVNEETHFRRTAETVQTVAMAIPHLSQPVAVQAKQYLTDRFAEGWPLRHPAVSGADRKRREAYDLSPALLVGARQVPRYRSSIDECYAIWAYAHYADAYDAVLRLKPELRQLFESFASSNFKFNSTDQRHDGSAEQLNRHIAGLIGYARLMRKAGDGVSVDQACKLLVRLAADRIHHERANHGLVRGTGHRASVPRYVGLVPEVGAMLSEHAHKELETHARGLEFRLPVWYQAFGERMIGGENYTSTPRLAHGMFLAKAYALQDSAEQLNNKLDFPWCKADLFYIDKLVAALRQLDK